MNGKVHLRREAGSRSRCRYSSRPSSRVRIVGESEFRAAPNKCSECARRLGPDQPISRIG